MKLRISKDANINYLAKVICIKNFTPHPNADRMKIAHIDGYNICVGIDEPEGWYVYFPTLSQINSELLSFLNLYRDKELNSNPEIGGFFNKNGRVSSIRLRGFMSEGFLLPYSKLQDWILSAVNVELPDATEDLEFDEVEHNDKTFWVCKKYIVPAPTPASHGHGRKRKISKAVERIIENQFHFHYDTVLLKKCPKVIQPNDIIHISTKIHGTSGISAYILCKRKLSWFEKVFKFFVKKSYNPLIYDYIYASRTVIKNKDYNPNVTEGYYKDDVWKYANEVIKPFLWQGMTIYYEIAGYLPNGQYIQKDYDYGCIKPNGSYVEGVNYKVYVYRITTLNIGGKVHEWSAREVQIFCHNNSLRPVTELYYGYAKDLYPELDVANHWNENFMEKLSNDFYMEQMSPDCNNKVPHEGIVIKKENMISEAFKLKSFAFLNKEAKQADAGESNIEDEN